ncbi:MAG: hypothetical protein GF398_10065 [Chitinivibrionales bacterium]|nr:hypothetical protein [Chitinivibrionales bacterium]
MLAPARTAMPPLSKSAKHGVISMRGNRNMEPRNYKQIYKQFRRQILTAQSALIVAHDYPDPDCIASALGIKRLLDHWGIEKSTICYGGFVGRSENQAMMRLLNIKAKPYFLVDRHEYERIILVDAYPGNGNVSLPKNLLIDAVIDHHPRNEDTHMVHFCDIRQNVGATSTIVTEYLLQARCPIDAPLATALFYGIKTDTHSMGHHASSEDLQYYKFLFDVVDHKLLYQIGHPGREKEYFRILHNSVESLVYVNQVGFAHMGRVSSPDYIAEIADLFFRMPELEWMVTSGFFNGHLFYSVRSKNSADSGEIAEYLAEKLHGSGGGHDRMAAGRVKLDDAGEEKLLDAFKSALTGYFNISLDQGDKII